MFYSMSKKDHESIFNSISEEDDMFTDKATLDELKTILPKLQGRSYCIVTRMDDGKITIAKREHQPCIGGNHRKYGDDGLNDCHPAERAKDYSPGDLSNKGANARNKFPAGKPVALGYNWPIAEQNVKFFEYVLGNESPWISGFKSAKHIEFFKTDEKNKGYAGWIVKTGMIDPTVWINCLKFLQGAGSHRPFWEALIAKGMSQKEAISACVVMYNSSIPTSRDQLHGPDGYGMSMTSSIKRVFNQNPRDLTGGLFSQRYDYNRPEVSMVFQENKNGGTPFVKMLKDKLPAGNIKPEVFVSTLSELLHKEIGA